MLLKNLVENVGWLFHARTESVHRDLKSCQALYSSLSNTAVIFPGYYQRPINTSELNTWAYLLLNHVYTSWLGDTRAASSLGQPFHLGEVQTCNQFLVIISFISKSNTHVAHFKMGIKALCGVADGSSSPNSCSQIFFLHYLLSKHITFPLGRWEGGGESLHFARPLAGSDSSGSTFNPAGIKLLQLEAMLTAAN